MLYVHLELLVMGLGALGLIRDSQPESLPVARLHLHLMFAVLLWLWVIVQFHRRLDALPGIQATAVRVFARRLSRRVYLLLYGLMCLNLCLPAGHSANFQFYLACGICALITIQVLAAVCLRNGRLMYGEPASPKRQG